MILQYVAMVIVATCFVGIAVMGVSDWLRHRRWVAECKVSDAELEGLRQSVDEMYATLYSVQKLNLTLDHLLVSVRSAQQRELALATESKLH